MQNITLSVIFCMTRVRIIPPVVRRRNTLLVSDYRRRMKQEAINYKGGVCQKCGYGKCVAALTFHHRDPEAKEFGFASGRTKHWKRVQRELDKCDLVCFNCHMEIHDEWKREDRLKADAELGLKRRKLRPMKVKKVHKINPWPTDLVLQGLVQTIPITKIAKQIGVSDRAVSKRCKKRGIATPPPGYWTQRQGSLAVKAEGC